MTDREIQQKLLEYYQQCYDECANMGYRQLFDYLYDKNIFGGVCFAATQVLKVDIGKKKWIKSNTIDGLYWGKKPNECQSKADILQALQIRINILTKILAQ